MVISWASRYEWTVGSRRARRKPFFGPVCNAIHRARMLALQKPEPAARDRLPFVEMLDHRHFPTNARLDRVLEKGGSHA